MTCVVNLAVIITALLSSKCRSIDSIFPLVIVNFAKGRVLYVGHKRKCQWRFWVKILNFVHVGSAKMQKAERKTKKVISIPIRQHRIPLKKVELKYNKIKGGGGSLNFL